MASFKATGSDLLDLVNDIIMRDVFIRAKSIRIVFLMTVQNVRVLSKTNFFEQLEILRKIIHKPDFNKLLASVKPVITKVKPGESEFDIEFLQH